MIYIEINTVQANTWLVDVVNQKIKCVRDAVGVRPQAEWAPYKELKGGTVGETLTIVWPEDAVSIQKVRSLRFTE